MKIEKSIRTYFSHQTHEIRYDEPSTTTSKSVSKSRKAKMNDNAGNEKTVEKKEP